MTILAIEALDIDRGPTRAVRGLDLTMDGPGWFGVAGANGAGKTSLLACLAGRLAPSGGRILLDGRDLTDDPGERAGRIGLTPRPALMPGRMTAGALIAAVAAAQGEQAARPQRLADLWAALDLDGLAGQRIDRMSDGQRQRTALYLTFLGAPPVILLDEPFNGLDPTVAADFRAALRALIRDEGVLVVSALHELTLLALHCDAGALLAQGELRQGLDAQALSAARTDLPAFEAAMVARMRRR